jgi:hypothetical protein
MASTTRYLVVAAGDEDDANVKWAFANREAAAAMLAAERNAAPAQTYMIVRDEERGDAR